MNLLTNAKAFLRMLTPLSILMFWACSIFASPIDTAILSPSFKNSETSIIVDDVCANPNVNVKGGANLIKIKGITTKSAAIQIFNSAWETVYNQQVSSDSVTVPNLAAGTYNVKVTVLQSGGKWPAVCSVLVNNVKVVTGVNPCNTDKQAPVFANCPQNINLTTSTTTAVAKWTPPTATDNCTATPLVSSNYNSGFAFPIGSKTITYTATDAKGNKATCNFTVNVAQTYNCRYHDSLALVDVYNTMGGANWVNKWDLTKPINTWAGIGTDSNGCVVALIPPSPIDKKNYPHKISPSISNLKSLQVLRLGNRNLIDTIPSSLDKLSNLKQFQFEENNLVGSIPSSFGNLVNLNSILGYNNKLTGLPSSLGNLPNLSELILFNNQFSGSIPASFSNLKTLSTLILHHNMLSGEIPKIPNLTSLDLSNNLYKDTLPFHLFDIKYSLNLSNNQFKGCIPNVYKALCGKQINLSNNPYLPNNGNFILFCENGTGNCESNKFCFNDTIQPYFTQCPSNIYLKTNTDTLIVNWIPPGAFDNCTTTPSVSSNITPNSKFLIGGTQVVYTAIDEKGNKGFCKFKIVVAKENCRQIDSLALVDFYNSTNGDLWQSAYKWDLKRPIDTWTGVKLNSDGCVKSFESWSLDLNGSLPQTIGNLTSIEVLIINASNLVGALPNSLSKLTSLDVLSIYNTQLTGTLSPTLGNLKSLRILQIGISNISGTIPDVLGDLENLEVLVLDRNKLTMGIPFELGKLSNLKILNLSENQLTGSVPASLSNLTNPNLVVNLGNNQLSGCLDPNLKKLCGKNIFIGGNPNLPNGGDWLAFCNTGFGGCDFNSCRNNDSLGLVALYNSTNGANWTNKWDLTKSINTWFGVTLSTKGCVLSINLQNNNLIDFHSD